MKILENKICKPCQELITKKYKVFIDINNLETAGFIEYHHKQNSPINNQKKEKKKDHHQHQKKDINYWKKKMEKK